MQDSRTLNDVWIIKYLYERERFDTDQRPYWAYRVRETVMPGWAQEGNRYGGPRASPTYPMG